MSVAELQELEEIKGLLAKGQQVGVLTHAEIATALSELDVDEAGKYPYVTAYLPFNRLADGTVHDW